MLGLLHVQILTLSRVGLYFLFLQVGEYYGLGRSIITIVINLY